ncbi:ABC transporter substrate-binding protein [Arachnia propionica]|uniref:ABC transporter substrate-binding protein n=1 Tax=Arachnia propionica TaxID=1750 RepID=UPI001639ED2F|nr:ABC transporter substrate-binding protein [Arachnia propionica]
MTITHVFGETTITERPQRVVTLGWYSQDVVAALGVVPVGVEDFTWGTVKEYLPWFKDKVVELGGELPELLRHDDAGAYDAASGAEEFVTSVSLEELGQVESQFHVGWGDVPDDVTRTLEHPLVARWAPIAQGSYFFFVEDHSLAWASSAPSVLSIPATVGPMADQLATGFTKR